MIILDEIYIDSTLDNIVLTLGTSIGTPVISSIKVWKGVDYVFPTKFVEVVDLLGEDLYQTISIPNSRLDIEKFDGVFFIEVSTALETRVFPIANLFSYNECILSKVVELSTKGCGEVVSDGECPQSVTLLSTLLNSLERAILTGSHQIASKIIREIDKTCNCCGCANYESIISFEGTSIGSIMLDNNSNLEEVEVV